MFYREPPSSSSSSDAVLFSSVSRRLARALSVLERVVIVFFRLETQGAYECYRVCIILYLFYTYTPQFLLSFSFLSLVIALSTLLTALQCSSTSAVSWLCDHRACISPRMRKNRHGHWVCWMPTGRKNGSM